jgi:tRNA wybutosine-synthesizing protein 3
MIDRFLKRKRDILSKQDKSSKGFWDKPIEKLCERINLSEDYYTTSSCSGRVVLMIDQEKKEGGLLIKVYHDLISFEQLKKDLDEIVSKYKKPIKLKMESCALHVACKTLEDAQKLYDKAKLAGWKKSGIIASSSRFMVELTSTEKLEFPIICEGKILVNDEFLKIIVDYGNDKLKRIWKKIEKLENFLN